ncbi:MAG: type II toxin-antitoxin system HicB family antitoxin [Candidatus Methanoperedens sp.]|nr:type II toxin-antitoxin system HicB family antitoxin [Candidatus Methanoperedens sp.]
MKFKNICEIDEEGRYIIEFPDLPGCLTEGETLEEALNNINEAILGCLNSRLKDAKENFLKKNVSIQNKFSISLDTNLVAEYA